MNSTNSRSASSESTLKATNTDCLRDLEVALSLKKKILAESSPKLQRVAKQLVVLNLEQVLDKLRKHGAAANWSLEKFRVVEAQYRCYLFLLYKYPKRNLPASEDIDEIWHAHILDTRKYARDCKRIFGRFMHHFPYLGMRGAADATALKDGFREGTQEIYRLEFGDYIYTLPDEG